MAESQTEEETGLEPGTVAAVSKNSLTVQTAKGRLLLEEVQLEGKKRMTIDAFLRGFPVEAGTKFGKE